MNVKVVGYTFYVSYRICNQSCRPLSDTNLRLIVVFTNGSV